jgi:hypothetical protein
VLEWILYKKVCSWISTPHTQVGDIVTHEDLYLKSRKTAYMDLLFWTLSCPEASTTQVLVKKRQRANASQLSRCFECHYLFEIWFTFVVLLACCVIIPSEYCNDLYEGGNGQCSISVASNNVNVWLRIRDHYHIKWNIKIGENITIRMWHS